MAPRKTSKAQSKSKTALVTDRAEAGATSNGNLAAAVADNGHFASAFKHAEATNGAALKIEEIQIRAYEIFMARGGTHGEDLADWFRAEQELKGIRAEVH